MIIMTIAEQIYTLVKTLPQEQASEILTFVESIHTKLLNASSPSRSVDPQVSQATALRATLKELHNLTQDAPFVDPVGLIQAGRQELDERNPI
jgi:hypothetical protein